MKGKFFYKIDYNTDNGKKQHRNSKVGKNYHNLESSGPKAGKTLYFLGLHSPLWNRYRGKTGFWMHNLRGKSDTKGCRRTKKHSGGNKIMTRNSKNEYSKKRVQQKRIRRKANTAKTRRTAETAIM